MTETTGTEEDLPQHRPFDDGGPDDVDDSQDARPPSKLRSAIEWVGIVAGALVVALVIKTFLLQAFFIPSASMEPTLRIDDRVLVNKLSYQVHAVNRGDVIVFRSPPNEGGAVKDLIKRVIATPGETVEGHDGHVYIGGRLLREPYLQPTVVTSTFAPMKIPAGHYWMMGDNRPWSKDSRVFGPISRSLMIGRAFVRVWPINSVNFL